HRRRSVLDGSQRPLGRMHQRPGHRLPLRAPEGDPAGRGLQREDGVVELYAAGIRETARRRVPGHQRGCGEGYLSASRSPPYVSGQLAEVSRGVAWPAAVEIDDRDPGRLDDEVVELAVAVDGYDRLGGYLRRDVPGSLPGGV